jgi:hypothetical protein
MWRPSEPAEDDVSDLPGIDPQSKRRHSRRRAWRDGLADQTVVKTLEHPSSPKWQSPWQMTLRSPPWIILQLIWESPASQIY